MSIQQGKALQLILHERFGPIVADIGRILFNFPRSLFQIRKSTEFSLQKVKEALLILIKFNIVYFKLNNDRTTALYSLKPENVFLMLRYPKYISLIKKQFDEETEALIEELLLKGCCSASELIIKTAKRLKDTKNQNVLLQQIKDKFTSIVMAKYVMKLKTPQLTDSDLYVLPEIDIKKLYLVVNGSITEPMPDSNVYWTTNFDRFHQDLRDQLIVNCVSNKFDENTGELIRILLQQMYIRTAPWVPVSNPIPILEVKEKVKKLNSHPQLIAFFEQYVSVLEQDCNSIINKVGEASGGSFQIEMKQLFTHLAWEAIEHIINEKFDTKASRIFRLVKSRSYIEPDQIQSVVMMPSKEAKRISYQLLEENFLVLNELKRSVPTSGPSKSFTLFHIRLTQVVRTILQLCYKTLFNIITRRHYEKYLNKRIIEKKQRVDTIMLGMRVQGATGEQLVDIEEMITPPENEVLEKIGRMMKKLSLTELELDDTIFLLQMYLAYE